MGIITIVARRSFSTPSSLPKLVPHLVASSSRQENVQLEGWVQRSQKRGAVNFAWINDGTSADSVQIVVPKTCIQSVPVGSAVRITGTWQESTGSHQNMELLADSVRILATDSDKNDFIHIDTPVFTANDCEGAGETFPVTNEFFGEKPTYLTVSGQLHLEAVTSGIARAYTLSGAYRADKQQSSSHLTEFKMIEAEAAFCDSLDLLLPLVGDYLKTCARTILRDSRLLNDFNSLAEFSSKNHLVVLESISETPDQFPRISYTEAMTILQENKQPIGSDGLNKKNEAFLVEYMKSPVFVTHFPTKQKPFYMKRTEDRQFTESFDFLCPIVGELAGGSIREESVDLLRQQGGSVEWYEECRRRGKPVSGGFGIGFERLLQVLLGVRNIKDTIPFPRWFKHCQC